MRALVVDTLGPDYAGCAVRELETPQPDPGEVRVRVRAAAVNFPDLLQTRGEYQHKPPLPFVSGTEFAGEVDAVGDGVTRWGVGDKVTSDGIRGGFCEYIVAGEDQLRRAPHGFSHAQAAAYGGAY